MNLILLQLPAMLAASEWTITRWLTPVWIGGVGVAMGLIAAAIFLGLILLLAKTGIFEFLRRTWVGFAIGLVGGGLITGGVLWGLRGLFMVGDQSTIGRDEIWLSVPPIWLFFSLILWCLIYCSNRRFSREIGQSLSTGVGAYLFVVALILVATTAAMSLVVEQPLAMLQATPTIFSSGTELEQRVVPGVSASGGVAVPVPIELDYDREALAAVMINSDRALVLNIENLRDPTDYIEPIRVLADQPLVWTRTSGGQSPIPSAEGLQLSIQNQEFEDATVNFRIATAAAQPEMFGAVYIGCLFFTLALLWFLQLGASPRLAAISMATAKSELSQPLPIILMLFVGICIVAFVYVPFHTLGEDIKLLKDNGITLTILAALFQGVWSASSSVSEEIEGRTALTLLSKPISRRSFLFGKFMGILWVIVLMFIVLGTIQLTAVAYKPLYDAVEHTQEQPLWQYCYVEMFRTLPGLLMGFMQVVFLMALAVALGTRLSQLANFAVCFAIYVIGHLTPSVISSSQEAFPIVQFFGQLIATVVPNLDQFSMNAAIDANNPVPFVYLSALLLYSLLGCSFIAFLGLTLFEDRDLT